MAKKFGAAWTKATKKLVDAAEKKLPKIEATVDLKNSFKFDFKAGYGDSFSTIEDPIRMKVNQATEGIGSALQEALDSAMAASWSWSEGARDIIDTGELRDSLEISVNGGDISITYNSPYAGLVHYGGYISPYGNASLERIYLPGRPWVTATLEGGGPVPQFDFKGYYEAYL